MINIYIGYIDDALSNTALTGCKRKIEHDDNSGKKKKVKREFNMSKFRQRHIALRIAYIGDGMDGFAAQENSSNTVEVQVIIII